MSLLSVAEVNDIAARHPHVFAGSGRRRLMNWGLAVGTVGYLIFAWWFFSVGSVVANGRWDIAGTYLADWVSYEVRPRIEYRGRLSGHRLFARRPAGGERQPGLAGARARHGRKPR